jgi:hypothetical protein
VLQHSGYSVRCVGLLPRRAGETWARCRRRPRRAADVQGPSAASTPAKGPGPWLAPYRPGSSGVRVRQCNSQKWFPGYEMSLHRWRVTLVVLGLLASTSVEAKRVRQPIKCDASKCYTPTYEIHADVPGPANKGDLTFTSPRGITFAPSRKGDVETEGGGAKHWVHALGAGPHWLKCEWYAQKKVGGDNGVAKGYCWVAVAKPRPLRRSKRPLRRRKPARSCAWFWRW